MQLVHSHSTLKNGIELVTDHAPHFQGVAIGVAFRIGSVHEPDEWSGISHLLEHMVFRGTQSRSGEDIQAAFGALGGFLNATTDEDSTVFKAMTLREDVEQALEIIAEMVSQPALDGADLEMERQIIEQENCRGCQNCSMRDAFFDQAYPEQSIRNPIIGYEDTLAAITPEDLRAWHRTAYCGANLTVAICGNVDHEAAEEMVGRIFSVLPEGKPAGFPEFSWASNELHLAAGTDRSTIRLGFPITNLEGRAGRAAVFYHDILGGHGQSLLMRELREKRGLVYSTWAEEYEFARETVLWVEASGEAMKTNEIAGVLADTMYQAAQQIDAEELAMAKRRAHVGLHMSLDDQMGRNAGMLRNIARKSRLTDWNESYQDYMSLTREEVAEAGRNILATGPTIISAGPVRNKPKFEDIRARLRGERAEQSGRKKSLFRLVS